MRRDEQRLGAGRRAGALQGGEIAGGIAPVAMHHHHGPAHRAAVPFRRGEHRHRAAAGQSQPPVTEGGLRRGGRRAGKNDQREGQETHARHEKPAPRGYTRCGVRATQIGLRDQVQSSLLPPSELASDQPPESTVRLRRSSRPGRDAAAAALVGVVQPELSAAPLSAPPASYGSDTGPAPAGAAQGLDGVHRDELGGGEVAALAAASWPPENRLISALPATMPPATPAAVVRALPRKPEPRCWNMPGL